MSVFQTFAILFTSNTEDVEKGADKAADSGKKLQSELKKVDEGAKKAGDSFSVLANRGAKAILPFLGLTGLGSLVTSFADNADAAGRMAKAVRMGVEETQAWQGAVKRAGGSAEGFTSSIQNLNVHLDEMRRTGYGVAGQVFWRLGISAKDSNGKMKDTSALLLDLSKRFEGMHRISAMHFGKQLGLDEQTIEFLRKGKKGVEEYLEQQKALGLYTKKDAEEARQYKLAMDDLRTTFTFVTGSIAQGLMPYGTKILELFTKAGQKLREHKPLVTGFFIALSVIMGVLAIKTVIAFAPFFLFVGIILALAAAFAILYDDVQAFMNGQNSMIGKLSEKYPWLGELVKDIVAVFQTLWDIGGAVMTFLSEAIDDPTQAIANFRATIDPLLDSLAEKFPELAQLVRDLGAIFGWLWDVVAKIFKGIFKFIWQFKDFIIDAVKSFLGVIGKGINWVANLIRSSDEEDDDELAQFAKDMEVKESAMPEMETMDLPPPPETPIPRAGALEGDIQAARGALAATHTPLASQSFGSAEKYTQNVQRDYKITVEKVEVTTQATDANGIAGDIGGSLESAMRGVADSFDDGVQA